MIPAIIYFVLNFPVKDSPSFIWINSAISQLSQGSVAFALATVQHILPSISPNFFFGKSIRKKNFIGLDIRHGNNGIEVIHDIHRDLV